MTETHQLKNDELYRILDLAKTLGEAETTEHLVERALLGLFDLIPGLSVSWNEIDLTAGVARAVIRPDPGSAWFVEQAPLFTGLMHQSPLIEHFDRTGDTRALRWEDVAPPGTMQRTELYERFYVPLGIHSQLIVSLPAPPGVYVALAVNRGTEGFSDRDRAILSTLRPHVVNAYRSVCHQVERALLRAAITRSGWQVLLVDGFARVLDTSRPWSDSSLRIGERLPSHLGKPLEHTLRTLAREKIAAVSDPIRMQVEEGLQQAWIVGSELGPHVILLRPDVPPPLSQLKELGLSPREIEVALALTDGGSNERIARRLGIAIGTVRKHLERIYTVLEVNDRTSAAARVRGLSLETFDDTR